MVYNNLDILNGLITEVENVISVAEQHQMYADKWPSQVPSQAGIYLIRNKDKIIVYVGESSNINARMRDITRTVNHTFRRKVGAELFCGHPEYTQASSKRRYSDQIEELINQHCIDHFNISFIPLVIGRKEIEDYLLQKHDPIYNSKQKRGIK